jgi:hypothetical protein
VVGDKKPEKEILHVFIWGNISQYDSGERCAPGPLGFLLLCLFVLVLFVFTKTEIN